MKISLFMYVEDLIPYKAGSVVPVLTYQSQRMVEVSLHPKKFMVTAKTSAFTFIRKTTFRERLSMRFNKKKWRKDYAQSRRD